MSRSSVSERVKGEGAWGSKVFCCSVSYRRRNRRFSLSFSSSPATLERSAATTSAS